MKQKAVADRKGRSERGTSSKLRLAQVSRAGESARSLESQLPRLARTGQLAKAARKAIR